MNALALAIAFSNPTGSLWTPAQATGVTLWLDPTRGFTANTSWVDQIGSKSFAYTSVSSSHATAGAGIGGAATVDLDTASGYFSNASALSTVLTAAAWWCFSVFRYTGTVTEQGAPYDNAGIIGDVGGYWWQEVSTTKAHSGQYLSGAKDDTQPISTATNYYLLTKFDGTKIYTSLNGGAFSAGIASGNIGDVTHALTVGSKYNHAAGFSFKGSLGDIIAGNTSLTAADAANFPLWAHARYGI